MRVAISPVQGSMEVNRLQPMLIEVPLAKSRRTKRAGGHLDRVIFGDEMMVPESTLDSRLSVMSLAVAADSEWYQVDFQKADPYIWGKNKGCGILNSQCQRSVISEFCNVVRTTSCSDDFQYISMCVKTRSTGSCKINTNNHNCKMPKKRTRKSYKYGRYSICQNCQVTSLWILTGRSEMDANSVNASRFYAIDEETNTESTPIREKRSCVSFATEKEKNPAGSSTNSTFSAKTRSKCANPKLHVHSTAITGNLGWI